MRFWYHMYGSNIGSLNVYQNTLSTGKSQLTSISSQQGNKWLRREVVLSSNSPFQVIIEGVVGAGVAGDIAIDDISFTPGCGQPKFVTPSVKPMTTPRPNLCQAGQFQCDNNKCINNGQVCNFYPDCDDGSDEKRCPTDCTFEGVQGNCGFNETQVDGFDWQVGTGGDTSRLVAPAVDATKRNQNGHFLFINDGTSGHPSGKKAEVRSPTYTVANADCKVMFSYYAYGQSLGTLYLYVVEGTVKTQLWRLSKFVRRTNDQWHTITVGIGHRSKPFNLLFTDTATTYSGGTALDDIKFSDCSMQPAVSTCNTQTHFSCGNKACIGLNYVCDLTDNCGDGTDEVNCGAYKEYNFEMGFGDLIQSSNGDDDFDWTLFSGATSTSYTGPLWDHTTGTSKGHYIYMEASGRKFSQKAWLITKPFYRTTGKDCSMRFYSYMYGQYVNTLTVYYRIYNSGSPTKDLFTRAQEQGAYWERHEIPLNVSQSFQIIIEAKVGDSYLGDIAIDDLTFTPGCQYAQEGLPNPPATTPTPSQGAVTTPVPKCDPDTQFQCQQSNKCIPKYRVCNFQQDCNDGSDEFNCVEVSCGFGLDELCNWNINSSLTATPDQTYKWKIDQGITKIKGTDFRPNKDQSGQAQGYYLWADSSPGSFDSHTELYTPVIGQTGPQCALGLYYFIRGPSVGALEVYTLFNNQTDHLWSVEGDHFGRWQRAIVFIGARSNFQIVIQARRGRSFQGDISLDTVQFINCPAPEPFVGGCQTGQFKCANGYCIDQNNRCDYADDCGDQSDEYAETCDTVYKGRCSFEHGVCQTWFNDITDDFDWKLSSGSTVSKGTGPITDHTTRSRQGTYLYTESSSPNKPGQIARLASYIIKGSVTNCQLRFYYHMWGKEIGSLAIIKRYNYNSDGILVIGNITGNQGDNWIRGQYDLTADAINMNQNFEVVLQGQIGNGYHGDIAIDDISLTPGCEQAPIGTALPGQPTRPPTTMGACGANMLTCDNGNCYSVDQKCNFIDDCGDGTDERTCGTTCQFESGTNSQCGWRNTIRDNINWKLNSGKTPTSRTGPITDHSVGTSQGHYMYVEASGSHLGYKAILMSDIYYQSGPSCQMTFWYNMNGRNIGTLNVVLKNNAGQNNVLKSLTGNQGQGWKQLTVPLPSYNHFTILFEAVQGNGYLGDIAIDDIQFNSCAPTVEVKNCPNSQFQCASKTQCIDRRYRCDEKTDCSDSSDEDGCTTPAQGDCNFNTNLCQWTQSQDDFSDWILGQSTPNPNTGPSVDHLGSNNGQFLYINSAQMRAGDTAKVNSPTFPPSRGVCYVRMWYYMYGSSTMGPLNVYVQNANETNTQLWWTKSGNQGPSWQYVNLLVGSSQPFHVVIEGARGDEAQSDVAIDDVSFTPECATGKPFQPINHQFCGRDTFYCKPVNQCYPNAWKCDFVNDCPDGSDEFGCPTTPAPAGSTLTPGTTHKPKTLPPPVTTKQPTSTVAPTLTCKKTEMACGSGECIARLYMCDGVRDCTDGSDEPTSCIKCHPGYYWCNKQRRCINAPRCDSVNNCGDYTDESLCGQPGQGVNCPDGFCLNKGICTASKTNGASCNCSSSTFGDRCQYQSGAQSNPAPPKKNNGTKIGIGVAVGVLAVIGLVVGGYFFTKKRKEKQFSERLGFGLSNPSYDGDGDGRDFTMNEMDSPFSDKTDGNSIENPLYQDL